MLSDIILIITVVLISIFISYVIVSHIYKAKYPNPKILLEILIFLGIVYLIYLQNNQIEKNQSSSQNNKIVDNMNKYLITLSPLIPMVDVEGNPITYPPSN